MLFKIKNKTLLYRYRPAVLNKTEYLMLHTGTGSVISPYKIKNKMLLYRYRPAVLNKTEYLMLHTGTGSVISTGWLVKMFPT